MDNIAYLTKNIEQVQSFIAKAEQKVAVGEWWMVAQVDSFKYHLDDLRKQLDEATEENDKVIDLKDILVYLCENYPHKDDLSKTRITKMVYLVDWQYALDYGKIATGIEWKYNHYGPYVDDVYHCAIDNKDTFLVESTDNYYGNRKEIINVIDGVVVPTLPKRLTVMLDHVINTTKDLNWEDFINMVYSTYPIESQNQHTPLDLVALANECKQQI